MIIPAYNCEAVLARAIESALNQTFTNIECIVIDDGSKDNTAEVARSFGERVRLIEQANGGASSARNAGIWAASRDYIAFLDADDYWHPTKLEKQVALMTAHQDVVLVSTGFDDHSDDPAIRAQQAHAGARGCQESDIEVHRDYLPLFLDPYLGTPTVMVRTRAAREIGGFDTGLSIAEDLDFYFRICKDSSYARINQPLVFIHKLPGGLSHTKPGYRLNLDVIDRVERIHPAFAAAHPAEFNSQRLRIYESWAAKCILRRRGLDARRILRESRRYGRVRNHALLMIKSYYVSLFGTSR